MTKTAESKSHFSVAELEKREQQLEELLAAIQELVRTKVKIDFEDLLGLETKLDADTIAIEKRQKEIDSKSEINDLVDQIRIGFIFYEQQYASKLKTSVKRSLTDLSSQHIDGTMLEKWCAIQKDLPEKTGNKITILIEKHNRLMVEQVQESAELSLKVQIIPHIRELLKNASVPLLVLGAGMKDMHINVITDKHATVPTQKRPAVTEELSRGQKWILDVYRRAAIKRTAPIKDEHKEPIDKIIMLTLFERFKAFFGIGQ